MVKSMMTALGAAVVGIAALGFCGTSYAENIVVKELNKGPDGFFVFEPDLVKIKPGDSVSFVAADKGHDVQSVPGMIPAGAQPFKSPMSQNLAVTFTQPGVYVFECMPHVSLGMVGVIVVGSPGNLQQVDTSKLPNKARQKVAAIFQQITSTSTADAR
ncbi:MAG TPA: pseudoazurin [Stellaceae bacterium]|nr:pseudoazurin [Stellaceae bacterium]